MKEKLVVGNWKMFTDRASAQSLSQQLVGGLETCGSLSSVRIVICPPYTVLETVSTIISPSPIMLGAQNCHTQKEGAFTGEISAQMLTDLGCSFVILGHSERRRDFNETNELVGAKALAALAAGLTPIVCVGESLDQRESGETTSFITSQVLGFARAVGEEALASCVFAYEPIWAIGTGRAASPEQAEEVHQIILSVCKSEYSQKPQVLYGGSVNAENASQLFSQPSIDGALVGGASLKAPSFITIIQAAQG